MSLVWKIVHENGDPLFTKLSPTEVQCNECQQPIKTPNRGPANLKCHLATHPPYLKQLEEMEKAGETKKEAMQKGMAKFIVRGKGELSVLDKKIMHHIACTNQPFAVVESDTFKALLSSSDQANVKGREHYTKWDQMNIALTFFFPDADCSSAVRTFLYVHEVKISASCCRGMTRSPYMLQG